MQSMENKICRIEVKKILLSCTSLSDGIGDAAAAYYLTKSLLIYADVTLVISIKARDQQQLIVKQNTIAYINNIDTDGYTDLENNYHRYKHKFKIYVFDGNDTRVEVKKKFLLQRLGEEHYDVMLTGFARKND